MNVFKKTVVATALATASLFSFAANNGVGGGYWVHNLVPNAWAVQNTLMQSVTQAKYSCGPTSLLFMSNHFRRLDTGQNSPNMSTVDASKRTLTDMYSYLGVPYNTSYGTSLDQIKSIARGKFAWGNVARMSASLFETRRYTEKLSKQLLIEIHRIFSTKIRF
jgi:hypothetical protein